MNGLQFVFLSVGGTEVVKLRVTGLEIRELALRNKAADILTLQASTSVSELAVVVAVQNFTLSHVTCHYHPDI